jgi:hypothetical protein
MNVQQPAWGAKSNLSCVCAGRVLYSNSYGVPDGKSVLLLGESNFSRLFSFYYPYFKRQLPARRGGCVADAGTIEFIIIFTVVYAPLYHQ